MNAIARAVAVVGIALSVDSHAGWAQTFDAPGLARSTDLVYIFTYETEQKPNAESRFAGSATKDVVLFNRAVATPLPGNAVALRIDRTMDCATHEVVTQFQSYDTNGIALDNSQAVFDQISFLASATSAARELRAKCDWMTNALSSDGEYPRTVMAVRPPPADLAKPAKPFIQSRVLSEEEQLHPAVVGVRGALQWSLARDEYMASLAQPQTGQFVVAAVEGQPVIFDLVSQKQVNGRVQLAFYWRQPGARNSFVLTRVQANCSAGVYVEEDGAYITGALAPEYLHLNGRYERRFDGGLLADEFAKAACAMHVTPKRTKKFEKLEDAAAYFNTQWVVR